MASVKFEGGKRKGAKEAKAYFMHADAAERLIHEHSNEDIQKDQTHLNTDIKGLSYAEICEAYDKRIQEIDESGENENIRKDRVTCFSLEIPAPDALDEEQQDAWFGRVAEIIIAKYGEQNFLDMKIHRDEIHDYIDAETKKERTSRVHGHAFVVPEHDGGLNGKWFSSKRNMMAMNAAIHEMSVNEFDCEFMDGTKMKSKKRVETLKNASREAEIQQRFSAVRNREADARDRERALDGREEAVTAREKAVAAEWEKVSQERAANIELAADLQKKQALANKKTAYADKKVTEMRDEFKRAYTQILTENDKYHKGLSDKAELAQILGEKPLTKTEKKQAQIYPTVRRSMVHVAEAVMDEADEKNIFP